jgi:hypothetical protein
MLTRDWLSSKVIMDNQLDDVSLKEGKSYVNRVSSVNSSQIDVDILSAVNDLKRLNLINQYEVRSEQEAKDALKQLWNDAFD